MTNIELNKPHRRSSDAKAERAYWLLRQNNSEGLDRFLELHYPALALAALRLLNNKQDAENLAGNAFVSLWKKRQEFSSAAAVKTFLYRCVLESCKIKLGLPIHLQLKTHGPFFKALLEALVADYLVNVED